MMPKKASRPQNFKAFTQYNKQNTKLKICFKHQKTYNPSRSTDILLKNYKNDMGKSQ